MGPAKINAAATLIVIVPRHPAAPGAVAGTMDSMRDIPAASLAPARRDSSPVFAPLASFFILAALGILAGGCKHVAPLDIKPLDAAGMNYDTIKQLQSMQITAPEVAEISKARGGGLTDRGCVEIMQIYHGRAQAFDAGETVAGLVQVRMREDTILDLARLQQLGLGAGELQAIRLVGLSDSVVLAVAHRKAEGKPVLSGASLGTLKNTGLREATLLELVRRGVPDSQVSEIVALRRHRAGDADILRRYGGS